MNDSFFFRRDPAARLLVRGEDAATFLQGQFTNDLRRPGPGGCTYGLWLNQKGRVLADSFVVERGADGFAVVSLTSPVAVIRERLEAYIIADDVELEDATAESMGWLVSGPGLDQLTLARPEEGQFVESEGAVVFRVRASRSPTWYLCVGSEHVSTWTERMATLVTSGDVSDVSADRLQRDRIAAGLPEIPVDLGPGDLPNEGGLEHEAISFTKGCYLGQEVMARLHNMGQVRRRLFVVEGLRGTAVAATGDELFKGDKRVGDLRSIAATGACPAIALAMLHTTHVAVGDELASEPNGGAAWSVRARAEGRAW